MSEMRGNVLLSGSSFLSVFSETVEEQTGGVGSRPWGAGSGAGSGASGGVGVFSFSSKSTSLKSALDLRRPCFFVTMCVLRWFNRPYRLVQPGYVHLYLRTIW